MCLKTAVPIHVSNFLIPFLPMESKIKKNYNGFKGEQKEIKFVEGISQ